MLLEISIIQIATIREDIGLYFVARECHQYNGLYVSEEFWNVLEENASLKIKSSLLLYLA
jgi:hypothetical protein